MDDPGFAYQCPACAGSLDARAGGWACAACARSFPVVAGIPDFRLFPDPYINLDEDREKAARLHEEARHLDLAGLVRRYFELTPEVPPRMAEGYRRWAIEHGPARASTTIETLEAERAARPGPARVLDVGCGSGPFLPALHARFGRVVGADIALRWLVVARRRLDEAGAGDHVTLVSACAEHLPFPPNAFDLVVAAALIEHTRDPGAFVAEARRVLDKDGALLVTTPNRLSPGPDPHLGLWGSGLLPERLRMAAARALRGLPVGPIHTTHYFALQRLLLDHGFRRVAFVLPKLDASAASAPLRVAGAIYDRLRTAPVLGAALHVIGPQLQAVAFKGPNRS